MVEYISRKYEVGGSSPLLGSLKREAVWILAGLFLNFNIYDYSAGRKKYH